MYSISTESLEAFVIKSLSAVGMSARDAEWVAYTLVLADKRGIESHGTARLGHYISRIRKGSISADTSTYIELRQNATAVLDGKHAMGQIVNPDRANLAVDIAQEYGAGWVSIKNSGHCGALAIENAKKNRLSSQL